jgi:hypothetical protein
MPKSRLEVKTGSATTLRTTGQTKVQILLLAVIPAVWRTPWTVTVAVAVAAEVDVEVVVAVERTV